jgi:hypothetical protein
LDLDSYEIPKVKDKVKPQAIVGNPLLLSDFQTLLAIDRNLKGAQGE